MCERWSLIPQEFKGDHLRRKFTVYKLSVFRWWWKTFWPLCSCWSVTWTLWQNCFTAQCLSWCFAQNTWPLRTPQIRKLRCYGSFQPPSQSTTMHYTHQDNPTLENHWIVSLSLSTTPWPERSGITYLWDCAVWLSSCAPPSVSCPALSTHLPSYSVCSSLTPSLPPALSSSAHCSLLWASLFSR